MIPMRNPHCANLELWLLLLYFSLEVLFKKKKLFGIMNCSLKSYQMYRKYKLGVGCQSNLFDQNIVSDEFHCLKLAIIA